MNLLVVVAVVLILGVASRVIADNVEIPSVLFLIAAGVAIGPEGIDLVSRETFGGGLSAMVGVAVAIILFEGSFRLHRDRIREAPAAIFRLVTLGALIMWLGTATAVRVFLPIEWPLALTIGALLVATGPTVITPILNVVTVRDHISASLESEGIINDITAAILAVVLFEVLVLGEGGWGTATVSFAGRLVVGIGVGVVVAAIVWWLLSTTLSARTAPLHSRLIVLAGIVAAFAGAETIASETGIAAAATMGFLLGNVELPHREDVEGFTEDLTVIVLSFVFVALAALIDFGDIMALGPAGLFIVVVVTLLVRPLLIFLSARGERFTRNEKIFLSLVGPRGIIPASVATLFALELQAAGQFEEAQALAGTIFLIIFATVVFQAGLARQIADRLNVIPMRTIIIGAGRVGTELARRLEQDGENVILVEKDPEKAERIRGDGFRVVAGDGSDGEVLERADVTDAKAVIAATPDDDVNLLACQMAKTRFGVERVSSRVHDPENVQAFEQMGVSAISESLATAWSLENVLERPALSTWMNELGRTGDVQEIRVTAENLVDRPIKEINAEIPDGCIVGLVTHEDGESYVPGGDDVLEYGDHVTFIGQRKAVERAVKRFHPHD